MVFTEGFREHEIQSNDSQISIPTNIKLAEVEKIVILETLKLKNYNRTKTAKELGIGIRTLQRKLKRYGVYPIKGSELNLNQSLAVGI